MRQAAAGHAPGSSSERRPAGRGAFLGPGVDFEGIAFVVDFEVEKKDAEELRKRIREELSRVLRALPENTQAALVIHLGGKKIAEHPENSLPEECSAEFKEAGDRFLPEPLKVGRVRVWYFDLGGGAQAAEFMKGLAEENEGKDHRTLAIPARGRRTASMRDGLVTLALRSGLSSSFCGWIWRRGIASGFDSRQSSFAKTS